MLRTFLVGVTLIGLAGTARAVCGNGMLDSGERCDASAPITAVFNRCCNATCDGWLDADGDGLCDSEDLCTRSKAATLTEATLRLDRIAPPAGDERLRFAGRFRFPSVAFVDPAVAGFRFGLHGESYFYFTRSGLVPMIAARIPGGAGWASGNGIWRFRDSRGRYAGVTSVTLKLMTPLPIVPGDPTMTLAYKVTARRGGYVVGPDVLELYDFPDRYTWGDLQTQMALGSAADGSATCAQRLFPAFVDGSFDWEFLGPVLPCAANRRGSTITCSTASPIGPCRVGEPRDVLDCEVLAVAAAEDAYEAAHGAYFTMNGDCANMPGYTATPDSGVSCNLISVSGTSFTITAIHHDAPNWTCMYRSTETPPLDCF